MITDFSGLGVDTTTLSLPQFQTVTSSDPIPILSSPTDTTTTTLQYEGGYYGQPLISTAGGYAGVATVQGSVNPFYEVGHQIGDAIANHPFVFALVIGLFFLGGSKSRR